MHWSRVFLLSLRCLPKWRTILYVGIDDDRDGNLIAEEIQTTETLCNGEDGIDGQSSLAEVETLIGGAECPFGGLKITTGIDVDGDSVLSVDEVTDVAIICTGESTTCVDGYTFSAVFGCLETATAFDVRLAS